MHIFSLRTIKIHTCVQYDDGWAGGGAFERGVFGWILLYTLFSQSLSYSNWLADAEFQWREIISHHVQHCYLLRSERDFIDIRLYILQQLLVYVSKVILLRKYAAHVWGWYPALPCPGMKKYIYQSGLTTMVNLFSAVCFFPPDD